MTKIGSYDYPDMHVSEAISIVKIIYENRVNTASGLSTRLGHRSQKSGAFLMKLASLRRYGLIKSGVGGIELTALGDSIAKPKSKQEELNSLKELVNAVPLFIDIKNKLSGKQPRDDFWIVLHEVTKADKKDAEEQAEKIKKLYIDAIKYLFSTTEQLSFSSDVGGKNMMQEEIMPEQNILEIKSGALYMRLPRDLEAIEQAEIHLNAHKKALQEKLKKK